MEEEELSLKLLERFLPRFFKNIFEFYYNKDKEKEQNSHKVSPSNKGDINSETHNKTQPQSQSLFANISTNNRKSEHQVANFNPLSKPVTNFTRHHLLQSPVFALEYEFYEFIKQRLHMQAKYCALE